jgi:colanic acid biosynthesis glycosyl transferase WcaI
MRILLLNQCFYPDIAATAQHGWDLARHLRREGHEVTAIASRSRYGARGATLPREEIVEGIRIVRVGASLFGKSSIIARAIDFAQFYVLALWTALTLPRHDVCICLTTPPFIALVGWILRAVRGTKFVYWVMDLYPDLPVACGVMSERSLVTRFFEFVNHLCLRKADRVVVLGRCMEARVLAKGVDGARIERINVWSDQEEVKPIPREENPFRREWGMGDRLVVMYSGNFGIGHDIETIGAGVIELASDSRITFVFTGGGERKSELIDLLKRSGATNYIDGPYQPRERLGELLSAADVHLASLREGSEGIMVPSKLYGVLAAGRPVVFVGSQKGEGAQVIDEERCGIVVPCGDRAAFVGAIRFYADNRSEVDAAGQRGRDALTRKWSASHALRKWSRLVAAVASRPSRACAEG